MLNYRNFLFELEIDFLYEILNIRYEGPLSDMPKTFQIRRKETKRIQKAENCHKCFVCSAIKLSYIRILYKECLLRGWTTEVSLLWTATKIFLEFVAIYEDNYPYNEFMVENDINSIINSIFEYSDLFKDAYSNMQNHMSYYAIIKT